MTETAGPIEGIAIIGMACRFPGANSPAKYWQNLREGIESIRFFSDEELKAAGVPEEHLRDPDYVKAAPLVEDAELFDASLFGISPAEARMMDPQHRLFLECSWEAFENAGYDPTRYGGSVGVFAGCSQNHYLTQLQQHNRDFVDAQGDLQTMIGGEKDYLATRVAYLFDLRGPALTVQTACSTSLVAVRLACQSLWNYECDLALAGGSTVRAPRVAGYFYREGEIFSPDGHCRAFDEKAAGTIFGEGAGAVVLKRLSEAIADGDSIDAVIRGVAINNDGSRKTSFAAPSVEGQAEVISTALAMADAAPGSVALIEAHGTGTHLGDPIEIAALAQVFGNRTGDHAACALGSVKSNFGHLDAAAGIASLIKVALALRNEEIPPSLHYTRPNPHLEIDKTPFYIPNSVSPWPKLLDRSGVAQPRRAGVSSFGVGGTNAHVILEESPLPKNRIPPSGKPRLLVLSALSPKALENSRRSLSGHLQTNSRDSLDEIAYTLQLGRRELRNRFSCVARDRDQAIEALSGESPKTHLAAREAIRPIFMFPGQGNQYPSMARDLYREESGFRERIDHCAEQLIPVLQKDIRSLLLAGPEEEESCSKMMRETTWTQPALFCVEYSLAMLFGDWGIVPAAMIGHSIGEYVAATLAGVFSLDEALRLVALRGRIMQEQPPGGLLAVTLPEEEARRYVQFPLELALVNSPSHCVIGGPKDQIQELKERLISEKVNCTVLRASHAFHTWMMDAACPRLRDAVAGAHTQNPNIPFISNSTGNWITAVQATSPDYWAGQMRSSVRYSDGANVLLTAGHRVFLEVGPGTSLGTLLQYHANAGNTISIPTLRRVRRSEPETVLEAVGTLWAQGARVDWEALNRGERHHRVPLPTYPFESRRFWYGGNANQRDEADQPADQERKFGPTVSSEKPNRSQITAILSDIWKNLLATEEISPDEGFFELGGTSLMAAQLAVQIKQRLGLGLPLGVLIQAPTITKIAEFLEKAASEPQAWSPLVPIRTGGEGPSLFLVHGADANVLVYRELARLLNNVQVYGIQCLGADGQGEYHTDIPAMASYYIDELQSLQPHGPYLLGGFCMGGVIALEMAQQLAKKGERTNLVAMIETYNPRALKIRQNICFRSAFAVRNGYCHIVNWVLAHPRERVRYFVEKLLLEKARMKALFRLGLVRAGKAFGLNVGREYAHLEIGAINDRAYFAYDPHPYKGKLTVFRPKYDLLKWKRRDCGWSEIASEGVDIHVINTAAHGLLVHPFVSELSAEVLKAIHDAQES